MNLAHRWWNQIYLQLSLEGFTFTAPVSAKLIFCFFICLGGGGMVLLGLEHLKSLQYLDLTDNQIRKVEDIRALSFNTNLRALRLRGS